MLPLSSVTTVEFVNRTSVSKLLENSVDYTHTLLGKANISQ